MLYYSFLQKMEENKPKIITFEIGKFWISKFNLGKYLYENTYNKLIGDIKRVDTEPEYYDMDNNYDMSIKNKILCIKVLYKFLYYQKQTTLEKFLNELNEKIGENKQLLKPLRKRFQRIKYNSLAP